jgi:divalent metal cation (Fe/Co/Zn/Cd) transporter
VSARPPSRLPTAIERAREQAVGLGTAADFVLLVVYVTLGLLGGSLTILAEAIRGGLMLSVESYALLVLHRVHRGRVAGADFGAGKLEVVCNLLIAIAKLGAVAWITRNAVLMILAGHSDASPLGMALAASLGAVNLLCNLVTFEVVRDTTALGPSAIMNSQLISRRVKLRCSVAVLITLTVAAATAEPVVAAWADAAGAMIAAGIILHAATRTIRVCLTDLLDRAVDAPTRDAIRRGLDRHRDSFADLARLRARRSGATVFVELAMRFDPGLPLAEVERRVGLLRASVAAEVPGADASILPAARAAAAGGA